MNTLNARLLAAHATGDYVNLVALYREAAVATDDLDARAFYLTHAHVFALETGHPDASALRDALISLKREIPL